MCDLTTDPVQGADNAPADPERATRPGLDHDELRQARPEDTPAGRLEEERDDALEAKDALDPAPNFAPPPDFGVTSDNEGGAVGDDAPTPPPRAAFLSGAGAHLARSQRGRDEVLEDVVVAQVGATCPGCSRVIAPHLRCCAYCAMRAHRCQRCGVRGILFIDATRGKLVAECAPCSSARGGPCASLSARSRFAKRRHGSGHGPRARLLPGGARAPARPRVVPRTGGAR